MHIYLKVNPTAANGAYILVNGFRIVAFSIFKFHGSDLYFFQFNLCYDYSNICFTVFRRAAQFWAWQHLGLQWGRNDDCWILALPPGRPQPAATDVLSSSSVFEWTQNRGGPCQAIQLWSGFRIQWQKLLPFPPTLWAQFPPPLPSSAYSLQISLLLIRTAGAPVSLLLGA